MKAVGPVVTLINNVAGPAKVSCIGYRESLMSSMVTVERQENGRNDVFLFNG